VEEMEEDQWEDASSDLHIVEEIKEEPPSPSEPIADALDAKTLFEVASILQQNNAWEDLARDLGLEGEIPTFKQLTDPAKHLLIGCMVSKIYLCDILFMRLVSWLVSVAG
jgi:hypothetical protein